MKKKKTYYKQRNIYHGNNYIDVQMFPSYSVTFKKAKGKRTKPTSEMQKRLNEDNRQNKLIRLVNNNFTQKDYGVHLTYKECNMPPTEEMIKKDIRNFIRRIGRVYQKQNIELKYVWTAAKGERSGRPHFHLIMTGGVDREIIESLWGKGYAHVSRLRFGIEGCTGFSKYFCTQEKILYRTWSGSKNLKRPEEEEKRTAAQDVYSIYEEYENNYSYSEIESQYPGYAVSYIKASKNDIVGGVYVFARLYKKSEKYAIEKPKWEQGVIT